MFGNQIQTLLLLLDLDLFVFIVVFLLASKSCMYFSVVADSSYTSLGQDIKSNSYAKCEIIKRFQGFKKNPITFGLTISIHL